MGHEEENISEIVNTGIAIEINNHRFVSGIANSITGTSASIPNVAAFTEAQTAYMEEIQAAAVMLATLANELDEAINRFHV